MCTWYTDRSAKKEGLPGSGGPSLLVLSVFGGQIREVNAPPKIFLTRENFFLVTAAL